MEARHRTLVERRFVHIIDVVGVTAGHGAAEAVDVFLHESTSTELLSPCARSHRRPLRSRKWRSQPLRENTGDLELRRRSYAAAAHRDPLDFSVRHELCNNSVVEELSLVSKTFPLQAFRWGTAKTSC